MFENLEERLNSAIQKIKGHGRLSDDNIKEVVREIRLALLEADVNYQVVKDFTNKVKEQAIGQEVLTSLKPTEVFVKILRDELVELLGTSTAELASKQKLNKLMLVGLQGSGKTTTVGKLALHLRKKKHRPLLVAADVYRPAAIQQLKQIGKQINIDVYEEGEKSPVTIVKNAIEYAKNNNYDYLLVDTAGRLHINEELMNELLEINQVLQPEEIILIIDSMIGQDAINVIKGFNEKLDLTGAILTKMDGDNKGGVALSLRYLTDVPIKFIGVSEQMDGLEQFHPNRIADRLLGMGDIMSMVEKADEIISKEEAKDAISKMNKGKFDLEDFLKQMNQIKKMGSIENLIKMIPGAKKMGLANVNIEPKQLGHIEAIILSMTPQERKNPDILKASHKKRIAQGSGRSVEEVNRLLKQFEQMKIMMKKMKNNNFSF